MVTKILKRRKEKKRAFSQGILAFSNRIPFENNPFFAKDQELASAWESGWNNAFKTRKNFFKSEDEPIGEIYFSGTGIPVGEVIKHADKAGKKADDYLRSIGVSQKSIAIFMSNLGHTAKEVGEQVVKREKSRGINIPLASEVVKPGTPEWKSLTDEHWVISQKEKVETATPEELVRKQKIEEITGVSKKLKPIRTMEDIQSDIEELKQDLIDHNQNLVDAVGDTEAQEEIRENIIDSKAELFVLNRELKQAKVGTTAEAGKPIGELGRTTSDIINDIKTVLGDDKGSILGKKMTEAEIDYRTERSRKRYEASGRLIEDTKKEKPSGVKPFEKGINMKNYFSPSSIVRLLAIVLLLWALVDRHPYGYYKLLRWVVCGAGAYSTFVAMTSKKISWAWALGITAVVFNPIIPIHLDRDTWAMIDIVAAILFGVSTFFVREHR